METLGVDYLEFYQVGWFSLDALPHLTKKGGALEALHKAAAKVSSGISLHRPRRAGELHQADRDGIFDSLTIPYNMLDRSYAPTIKRAGELGWA